MTSITSGATRIARFALGFALALIAAEAAAQTITGTATYRERMAMPAGAVFEATLEDVSRADAPAVVVATTRNASPGNPPIAFSLAYDPGTIVANHRYHVRARILVDGKLVFTSDTATPVITAGNPTNVSMVLRHVAASQTGQAPTPPPGSTPPLEGTYWRAIELAGTPTPAEVTSREAHLVFGAGTRLTGSDGCNRLTGNYDLKGDALTFGQFAVTQMACPDTGDTERRFRAALKGTSRFRIVGQRLELYGATGKPLAVFERRAAAAPAAPRAAALQGTTWQLVQFQGGDGATLIPDDRTKYTLAFGADGRVSVRVDCNRGSATWKSAASSQLELGPLALTRAMCPDGSLHNHIVKQWAAIRSYVVRDGHLFLSLMADGGTYEFEPANGSPIDIPEEPLAGLTVSFWRAPRA